MKKIITLLAVLLMAGAVLSPVRAMDYQLKVAGVQVTSSNASNITGSDITSGKVSYDSSTQTLTLVNTVINTSEVCIYNYGIDGLKIAVEGDVYLVSTSSHGIHSSKKVTITSTDFGHMIVRANTSNKCAIWVRNGNTLRIEKTWVYAEGYYALTGDSDETLELSCCQVKAEATGAASCVCDFKEINTWGVTYTYDGSSYNSSSKRMKDSSGNNLKKHTLAPRLAVGRYIWDPRYDASISSSNTAANINSGSVNYDANTSTLTLNSVWIILGESSGNAVTYYGLSSGNTLNIKLSGSNLIKDGNNSGGYGGIRALKDLKISGQSALSSSLTIETKSGVGINISSNKVLTLENAKIVSSYLRGDDDATLIINNCIVSSSSSVTGFKSCTMTGCDSRGCYFDSGQKGFCDNHGWITQNVSIALVSATYPIYVMGRQMNNANASLFCVKGLEGGSIKYNSDNNQLTLEDLKFIAPTGSSEPVLRCEKSNLDIVLKGLNTLSTDGTALLIGEDTSISGTDDFSGLLKLDGTPQKGITFASRSVELTLMNHAVVDVKGSSCGIGTTGSGSNGQKLVVSNATLRTREGGVKGLADINLSGGVNITTPKTGSIDYNSSRGYAIVDETGKVATTVQVMSSSDPDFVFSGMSEDPADVNTDGDVDVADITAVIKAIKARNESNSY